MRITYGVLCVFLVLVVVPLRASDPPPIQSPNTNIFSAENPSSGAVAGPFVAKQLPKKDGKARTLRPFHLSWPGNLGPAGLNGGCLTMRTYIVARESADSDVTRPAGYTTCVPATNFQVKNVPLRPSEGLKR
jgi:hypothetical protein